MAWDFDELKQLSDALSQEKPEAEENVEKGASEFGVTSRLDKILISEDPDNDVSLEESAAIE